VAGQESHGTYRAVRVLIAKSEAGLRVGHGHEPVAPRAHIPRADGACDVVLATLRLCAA